MQGYYAAPRVKLACKQYACDAQTRDSRSGADARVVRCDLWCACRLQLLSRHGL